MIKAVALSDEEFAKFKCRGGTFYQYGNADGGHTVTEINEYASADNNYQGSVTIVHFRFNFEGFSSGKYCNRKKAASRIWIYHV